MDLPRISDEEFQMRGARLQAAMAKASLDLMIAYADDHAVAGPAHARYLADFAPHQRLRREGGPRARRGRGYPGA